MIKEVGVEENNFFGEREKVNKQFFPLLTQTSPGERFDELNWC